MCFFAEPLNIKEMKIVKLSSYLTFFFIPNRIIRNKKIFTKMETIYFFFIVLTGNKNKTNHNSIIFFYNNIFAFNDGRKKNYMEEKC